MKGDLFVRKNEPKKKTSPEFDEQGVIEVSNQIMDSYNSGFIGQGEGEPQSSNDSGKDDSGAII